MKSSEIIDSLFGAEDVKILSRQRVENEMERLVHNTEVNFLASLKSTSYVADLYDSSRQAILARATRLRKQRGEFGWKFGREWVFTPAEVIELKPDSPGRPWPTHTAA